MMSLKFNDTKQNLNLSKKQKGAIYEKVAFSYCRRKKLKIIARNLRVGRGEIDCLAFCAKNKQWVILEVRGRRTIKYRPSRFISLKKLEILKSMGQLLSQKYQCSVRIVLLEVLGEIADPRLIWGVNFYPELLGLKIKDYELN